MNCKFTRNAETADISLDARYSVKKYVTLSNTPSKPARNPSDALTGTIVLRTSGAGPKNRFVKYVTLSSKPLNQSGQKKGVLTGMIRIPKTGQLGKFVTLSDQPIVSKSKKQGAVSGTIKMQSYGRYSGQLQEGLQKYITLSPALTEPTALTRGIFVGKIMDLSPIKEVTSCRQVPEVFVHRGKALVNQGRKNVRSTFKVVSKPTLTELLTRDKDQLSAGKLEILSSEETDSFLNEELNQLRANILSMGHAQAEGESHQPK